MNLNQKILLLNINNRYIEREIGQSDTYDIVKGNWCVGWDSIANVHLACAVVSGEIIDVFSINKWEVCQGHSKRKFFEGGVAPAEIRGALIGKSVKKYWKRGSQNPVKYAELKDILNKF